MLAIGRGLEAPRGVPTEVLELGGARVIPGLIDAHVHLAGGGGESGPASRVPRLHLQSLSLAGVTSARVELEWNPPWDPRKDADDEVRAMLGIWD